MNINDYLLMVSLKQKMNYFLVNIHSVLIKYLYGMSLLLAALEAGVHEGKHTSMGNEEVLSETCITCRATMLLASQRCGGMALRTGVLEWMDVGSSGGTVKGDEEGFHSL